MQAEDWVALMIPITWGAMVAGAVVFTPLEVVLNVAVFQLVVVFVLGLEPVAAAVVGYVAVFYGMFQHFNIRTPQWLGRLIDPNAALYGAANRGREDARSNPA